MRISDWSSDVCSSDLLVRAHALECAQILDALCRGGTCEGKRCQQQAQESLGKPGQKGRAGHGAPSERTDAGKEALQPALLTGPREFALAGRGYLGVCRSAERRVGEEGVMTCRSWWVA